MTNNQITTATNVQAPDLSNTQQDPNKFFNNFFAKDFSIGAANDVIVSYFEKYTGSSTAGQALAAAVLYTAQAQNLDPLAVLGDFQKLKPNELNNYLAAFLNFNRVPTSLIGIKSTNNTSPYVTRSILP
jgi:hypothetical protein